MANQSIDTAPSRSRLPPIVAGVLLAAAIAWVQFGAPFPQYGFFINIGLGILFYFCYAWYERIAAANEAARTETGSAE